MLVFHSICTHMIQVYKRSIYFAIFVCIYTHISVSPSLWAFTYLYFTLWFYICWEGVFVACPCSNPVFDIYFMSSYQMSLNELRERVANGGDPSKLHEPPGVQNTPAPDAQQGIYYICICTLLSKSQTQYALLAFEFIVYFLDLWL